MCRVFFPRTQVSELNAIFDLISHGLIKMNRNTHKMGKSEKKMWANKRKRNFIALEIVGDNEFIDGSWWNHRTNVRFFFLLKFPLLAIVGRVAESSNVHSLFCSIFGAYLPRTVEPFCDENKLQWTIILFDRGNPTVGLISLLRTAVLILRMHFE